MTGFQRTAKKLTQVAGALGITFAAAGCSATRPEGPDTSNFTDPQTTGQKLSASEVAKLVAPQNANILKFYNVHTGEGITVTRNKGEPISDTVNMFMRDYRRDEKANMSPKLFDLLQDLKGAINQRYPSLQVTFQVVSSYRASATNKALQAAGGTQADNSQHIHGNAMDIMVPGVSTKDLRDIATCLKGGGVGYYEQDGFVHVDVARVRYWPSHDYLKNLKCAKP